MWNPCFLVAGHPIYAFWGSLILPAVEDLHYQESLRTRPLLRHPQDSSGRRHSNLMAGIWQHVVLFAIKQL